MSRKKRTVLFLIIAAAAAAAGIYLLIAGTWLAARDPVPPRLDVIFMFFGENTRFSYSRELIERFPGARLVMSDNFMQYSRRLSREGFDMSRVTAFDTCRYTLSEVKSLAGWLEYNRGMLMKTAAQDTAAGRLTPPRVQVGLVSSPCHMRRIKFMARDVIRDTSFRCSCLPVPLERYGWTSAELRAWWKTKTLRSWVASETVKLLWYWLFF